MFTGTETVLEKRYPAVWPPRSFVVRCKKYLYRCEHCGHEFRFPIPAEESFFCNCNQLVTTLPETERVG